MIMTEKERKEILRDAPKIVARGIERGLISFPLKRVKLNRETNAGSRWVYEAGRQKFFEGLTGKALAVAKSFEDSRPSVVDYPDTKEGYTSYRYAFKNWAARRRTAVEKAKGLQ